MGILIILFLFAIVTCICVLIGFKIIPQSETKIIERLGKYHRTLPSGINIIWPILDKARVIRVRYPVEIYDGNGYNTHVAIKIPRKSTYANKCTTFRARA